MNKRTPRPWATVLFVAVSSALILSAAIFFLLRTKPTAVGVDAVSAKQKLKGPEEELVRNGRPLEKSVSASPAAALDSYREQYKKGHDYGKVAQSALPAATAGDPAAQFYLSQVLEKCSMYDGFFLKRRGRVLSLGEALQWASQRHLPIAQAQAAYERCHELQTGDISKFGRSADWLVRAAEGGLPMAQATIALKVLQQEQHPNSAQKDATSNEGRTPELDGGADPRSLFRQAIESRDPDVLYVIGEAQSLLYPTRKDLDVERYAWWLTACQRGMDCTANGSFVTEGCADIPECQSAAGPTDLIQGFAGEDWPKVQQRAAEIGAQLDSSQWDDLIPETSDAGPQR